VFIIVDPVVSAVNADSHKNSETRRALQPLVDLAARFKCALVGITHLTKGTQGRDANERVTGSLAFVALARVVFQSAVAEAKAGCTQRRIFVRSKSNLGPSSGGYEYTLDFPELEGFPGVFGSRVTWGSAIEGSARSLLTEIEGAEPTGEGRGNARSDARSWLQDRLAGGAIPTNVIRKEALADGHSWPTVRRAKDDLKIKPVKSSNGPWLWSLPSTGQFGNLPVLMAPLGPSLAQGAQDAPTQLLSHLNLTPPPLPNLDTRD